MKRLMGVVVGVAGLAALAAVALAIWMGNHLAEPTVVPDPYEEGLRYDETRAGADAEKAAGENAAADAALAHAHDAAAVGLRAPPRCDLGRKACAQRVDGATIALEVGPRPLRTMRELTLTVEASPPDAVGTGPGKVSFSMPGMWMGDNRTALEPDGAGRWRGHGTLVRCPTGKKGWAAEVELPAREGEPALHATFLFEVVE